MGSCLHVCVYACVLLLVRYQAVVSGDNCEDLTGNWYNSLGSEMRITNHTDDHMIEGEYRTAVEREEGAAGTSHSIVAGSAHNTGSGVAFAWSVSWRDGRSNTVWTGECAVCDGYEVIMSSWILRSMQDSCVDVWKAVLIGQDFFTRHEQAAGPRRHLGTHTPSDRKKRDIPLELREGSVLEMETLAMTSSDNQPADRMRRDAEEDDSRGNCSILGVWYNEIGSKITLQEHGTEARLTGPYETYRERHGEQGSHSDIYGLYSPQQPNRTMSMMVTWNQGQSVTGWVAQCHYCRSGDDVVEVLEATWIHRYQVTSCADEWKSTLYGRNSFYRDDFVPVRSDQYSAPATFGEEMHILSPDQDDSSSVSKMAASTASLLAIVFISMVVLFQ